MRQSDRSQNPEFRGKTERLGRSVTDHSNISHKLSKAIRQAEKVSQAHSNGTLYSDKFKSEKVLNETNVKIKTGALGFKDCASFYSVEILYSFNFELQLKDIESAINSKLKNLLLELRGFKL